MQRSWSDEELVVAVRNARSIRAVLLSLGLVPAGGNYMQITRRINLLAIDTSHFTGQGWSKGSSPIRQSRPLEEILCEGSDFQSFKLKRRLFIEGIKTPKCELCGWAEVSSDGRIPVELDHINGNHKDNRLHNLRILCPNCHSLQVTHRGKNKKMAHARVVESVDTRHLKCRAHKACGFKSRPAHHAI